MGSGAMTYIPSFIEIGLGIQKLIGEQTYRQDGNRISLLLFFVNKESRQKTMANIAENTLRKVLTKH
jgi:hypothetical protein